MASRRFPGRRFSLGLWIGGSGSPNKIAQARTELAAFRMERGSGNPLVLTECPWCRAEIGRFDGPKPQGMAQNQWKALRVRGISDHPTEGPLLLCPDGACAFGSEQWNDWLPVEVIDERIYDNPPSLVIATADKFAMIAFRPKAGALFGRSVVGGDARQVHVPPGLIVQDELHLISGPLGNDVRALRGHLRASLLPARRQRVDQAEADRVHGNNPRRRRPGPWRSMPEHRRSSSRVPGC